MNQIEIETDPNQMTNKLKIKNANKNLIFLIKKQLKKM